METCSICNKELGDQPTVVIKEKGATGINTASESYADNLHVKAGDIVHQQCRKDYCKPQNIAKNQHAASPATSKPPTLRSGTTFHFKDHCVLCGYVAKYDVKSKKGDVRYMKQEPLNYGIP